MFGNVIGKFKNNPFNQSIDVLDNDLENLIKIVEGNGADEIVPLLREAFEYFCKYPENYDGASGDEESGAAKKYDIPSIIHDYLSVIGLDYNYHILKLSDELFITHMKALHFSSIQIAKRKIGLALIAPFRYVRRLFMARFDEEFKEAIRTVDFYKWYGRLLLEKSVLE